MARLLCLLLVKIIATILGGERNHRREQPVPSWSKPSVS